MQRSSTSTQETFHTETKPALAAGQERKDKAALSLGAGETLIPARLRALRAECVRIYLPPRHQQPRRTGWPIMLVQWDSDAPKVVDAVCVYGSGRTWQTHGRAAKLVELTQPGARRHGEEVVRGQGSGRASCTLTCQRHCNHVLRRTPMDERVPRIASLTPEVIANPRSHCRIDAPESPQPASSSATGIFICSKRKRSPEIPWNYSRGYATSDHLGKEEMDGGLSLMSHISKAGTPQPNELELTYSLQQSSKRSCESQPGSSLMSRITAGAPQPNESELAYKQESSVRSRELQPGMSPVSRITAGTPQPNESELAHSLPTHVQSTPQDRSHLTPYLGPWGPLPAGGLDLSKTLQPFAANHGQTYRGRALLVENFQRAETAKPVHPPSRTPITGVNCQRTRAE
ncbi:hypothetical protein THAOC_10642 [Thalassiosira oceanica]|uniref:Uncharacterized protein n=1 Tax=Thalassiosira oceanica TaxID=159749 RepID=K0TCL8_THAOC|nr:hypothetical protein THAOC_10642 [Thalassiosira oceanica]|eukprot:EJK68202.1 hypothetical protein THAOC_10642 [Thalassiosira oceanica]